MIFFTDNISFLTGLLLKTLLFLSFLTSSCSGNRTVPAERLKTDDKPIISYAKRFKIDKMDGYTQLSVIDPWQGADNFVQKWYLVPRGTQIPSFIDTLKVIRVPVKKIICTSTTHIAMISAVKEIRSVEGFSGTRLLYSRELSQKAEDGTIREIGYEENLNKELILKLNPDLVMVYGINSESSGFTGKLKELGVKVLYNADYLENDPLGKAEWVKMIGALYSREYMADSIFRSKEKEYNRLKAFIATNAREKPEVLLGLPFKDTWYISPGNSYISKLIEDAGGRYLWQSKLSSEAIPMGIENVYVKALSADFWLNTGTADTRGEILSVDARLGGLPCFKNGNLFNNNNRINANGGNDYWESGSLNPDIILYDIASILHPDLFPGRNLYYYKKLY